MMLILGQQLNHARQVIHLTRSFVEKYCQENGDQGVFRPSNDTHRHLGHSGCL